MNGVPLESYLLSFADSVCLLSLSLLRVYPYTTMLGGYLRPVRARSDAAPGYRGSRLQGKARPFRRDEVKNTATNIHTQMHFSPLQLLIMLYQGVLTLFSIIFSHHLLCVLHMCAGGGSRRPAQLSKSN